MTSAEHKPGTHAPSTADPPPGPTLDDHERRALLALAHRTVEAVAGGATPSSVPLPDASAGLAQHRGAFVSLYDGDDLRGCIGTFDASHDLVHTVRDMAAAAALRDPRFAPVTAAEAGRLHVEISALTPRRAITGLDQVVIGRHGLEVTVGGRRGVLLPQVAVEHGLSPLAFVEATCRKAGLPPDAWQRPAAVLETFEAEVFGDEIDAAPAST